MKDKPKKLCKLMKKDIEKEEFQEYIKLIKDATHVCKKCGRASNNEKGLCSPKKIQ